MADKRTAKKGPEFWTEKETLATAFEAGTDVVATTVAAVTQAEEAVVES
jgi:hypothetical protein